MLGALRLQDPCFRGQDPAVSPAQDPFSATHLSSLLPSATETAPSRRPVLIAMFGPNPGTVYPIEGEMIIGRGEEAAITIPDDRVSRRHTRIVAHGPDSVTIKDLGSKNGTWVNGRRITSAELQNGDTIQVGSEIVFHFVYRDPIEQRLLERQKMEAIGRLAGGVAHEFNNLLTIVLGNMSQLLRELQGSAATPPMQLDMLRDAIGAADRATEMTQQLLGLARRSRPSDGPVNVSSLVEDLGRLVGRTLVRDIAIKLDIEPGLHIRGQAPELQQALLNLCLNARDAMLRGGVLTLRVHQLGLDDPRRLRDGLPRGNFVEIRVEDTGVGMEPETVKHVFEPFFTTKSQGEGTGLGMSIVHGIVTGHGGHIDVQSQPGRGTTIAVFLPCVEAPVPRPPAPPTNPGTQRGPSRTILVVEDEDALRRSVMRMLQHLGHKVLAAADGIEAVDLFRRHAGEVDIVILDVSMPRQSGAQTFEALRALSPTVRVLLSSGYHGDHLEPALRAAVDGFLPKPYSLQQLIEALKSVD